MKKVIGFAGSSSKASINKQLVGHALQQLQNVETVLLDLNDFELPLYSIDLEIANGIPDNARRFLTQLQSSDGIILSLAEHNGAYSAVFKNIFDWMSRIDGKLWHNLPMLLMATSPGGRGGASVLEIASGKFPRMDANIVAVFSLPFFGKNFSGEGILDKELKEAFSEALTTFENNL
tara:strand:+ start:43542 stop:44072 length:531 start_codon:yes stop_codon:yes gene_type:complete